MGRSGKGKSGIGSGESQLLLWSIIFEIPIRLPNAKSKFTSQVGLSVPPARDSPHLYSLSDSLVPFLGIQERATVPLLLREKNHTFPGSVGTGKAPRSWSVPYSWQLFPV